MKKYHVIKDSKTDVITYVDTKDPTLDLTPKKSIKMGDSISVDKMVIINPSLSKKLIIRRLNLKFKQLYFLIQESTEEDDDDKLNLALDETRKLRMEALNKYLKFFDSELDSLIKNLEEIELTLLKKKNELTLNNKLKDAKKEIKTGRSR